MTLAPRPACLIVNPHAGGGRAAKLLPTVETALRLKGFDYRVVETASLAHSEELAREALERSELVLAMGGDGLVGAIAGVLRGTEGTMGILPGGRGNDFARKLGLPRDPAKAVGVLLTGIEKRLDVADADGRAFLGIASAGIDSDVQDLANATRLPLGGQVYTYATLRSLPPWRPADWTVTLDGDEHEFTGFSVAVCNSGVFGGGMFLAPDAALDDGLLEVVFSANASKLRFLLGLGRVFNGSHLRDPHVTVHKARDIRFDCSRPFKVYADGDPITRTPARITVQPGALRVVAPS